MKVGILTYHAPYNFGANLQAFTTFKALETRGVEVKILDYQREESNAIYRKMVPQVQWAAHDEFIQNRLPLTRHARNKKDLCDITDEEQFDGIIVGADAVWSFSHKKKEMPAYFMDWLFNNRKISHVPAAAMSVACMSNGYRHIDKDTLQSLGNCISRFSLLTTRDNFTKTSINHHVFSGQNVITALNPDPVFCLPQYLDNMDTAMAAGPMSGTPYIVFTLPRNSMNLVSWFHRFKKTANDSGYKVVELPLPEGNSGLEADHTVPFPIDPLQWYHLIIRSSGFLGMRFHSTVSAISGGIPFFSVDTYGPLSLPIRILNNRLGFYQVGRRFNKKSKIFQLLKDTGFCWTHRVFGPKALAAMSPVKVFHRIIDTDRKLVRGFQSNNCAIFQDTLDRIIAVFDEAKTISDR